ncbi:MAG: T9SS type A sorting domain-containing protein [Bacteroidota bacterium]|nr:T9SS type A sorting domain-containing protein [Bacteroidota bacterium]
MKHTIVCLFLLMQFALKAQNITVAEYFLDTDPGKGNGTAISFTPATDIALSIPLSTVSKGFHVFYVRVKDSLNHWSHLQSAPIYNSDFSGLPNLNKAEYFFDTDPGVGKGTSILMNPADNINQTFIASLTGLSLGQHKIYIRIADSLNQWSLLQADSFTATGVVVPDSLLLNIDTIFSPFAGNVSSITVSSNRSWTVVSNQTWATVNPISGSGNGSFAITSAFNTGTERNALITASAGTVTKNVYIIQNRNTTGLNYLSDNNESYAVYPNPSFGILTLEFYKLSGNKIIQLFDLSGKLMLETHTENTNIQLNLEGFAKGIYLLKVYTDTNNLSTKIIVE